MQVVWSCRGAGCVEVQRRRVCGVAEAQGVHEVQRCRVCGGAEAQGVQEVQRRRVCGGAEAQGVWRCRGAGCVDVTAAAGPDHPGRGEGRTGVITTQGARLGTCGGVKVVPAAAASDGGIA